MLNEIKIPTKEEIENQLGEFLPTVEELERMSDEEFKTWARDAPHAIRLREIERNPVPLIRKRISKILQNEHLSELEKEKEVARLLLASEKEFECWWLSFSQ